MPRTTVQDPGGTRWRVRARRGRVLHDRTRPDAARDVLLRELLAGMLGPWPVPAGHPALEVTEPAEEQRRREIEAARRFVAPMAVTGTAWWASGSSWSLLSAAWAGRPVLSGVCWLVQLEACGRLRRGATWQVIGGQDAADRAAAVAAVVAADIAAGRLPEPRRGFLVDVVDRRPNHPGAYRTAPAQPG